MYELLKNFARWYTKTLIALFASLWEALVALFPVLPPDAWGEVIWFLAMVNRFFPLAESVVLVNGYVVLRMAVFSYRLVKSWIPGVSG